MLRSLQPFVKFRFIPDIDVGSGGVPTTLHSGSAGARIKRLGGTADVSRNTLYLKIYTRVPQVMCREAQTDLGAQTECEELGPQAGQEKRKANLRFAENRDVDGQLVVPKASACVPQSAGLGWSSTFRSVH